MRALDSYSHAPQYTLYTCMTDLVLDAMLSDLERQASLLMTWVLAQVGVMRRSLQKDFGEGQLFDVDEEKCLWIPSREHRIRQALERAFQGLRGFQATDLGKQSSPSIQVNSHVSTYKQGHSMRHLLFLTGITQAMCRHCLVKTKLIALNLNG